MSDHLSLQRLGKTAGIDLVALKLKYESSIASSSASSNSHGCSRYNTKEHSGLESNKTDSFSALDKYIVCRNCNGMGTTKSIYNFMVLEKECNVCDGESIIPFRNTWEAMPPQYKKDDTSGANSSAVV
jgi:DnaJ-class molecular chaperone